MPRMSPSLHVKGFKLKSFDPKPRRDLVPRWKRSWISWETGAIAVAWPAGRRVSDRLAEHGSMSLRGAGVGQERSGPGHCQDPYKEPSWAELWERQLAQPQVTRASLSFPALQQAVFIRPLFVP